jgi:predicted ATPase/DNA-binding SARP family transcriptional activator
MNDVPPLKITTLGGLSILRGEQPVSGFISRKVEALLVYLAFERREHPRELLAELLWDDLTQARAMGNLRTVLSSLQSQLSDYLLVTRQSVMINPDASVWLDALELERAFKTLDGELSRSVVRMLETAIALYRGEFLAGFHIRDAQGFEGWMLLESERLRGKVIETLQRLIRRAIDHNDYMDGIGYARRLLGLDPLWEEAHRNLMLLLARSGQRSAALLQYETCARQLREELDVAPEPETTRLYAQIQAEQITATPHTSTVHKPMLRLPTPATPFIERPTEIKAILERLNNPDCRLLSLVGPGGIGKTRLALQAAAEQANEYRDGVYFVSLIAAQSGDFLPVEIAGVLRFSFQGMGNPAEELLSYLTNKELLLVLDNFDHLVGSAEVLSDILAHAPAVRILVTSREWLNLQQEWVFPVDGMVYPKGVVQDAARYSAVQLFISCAQRVRPRFSLEEDREAVIKICQLVEGMPLCIELAATWLRAIPASEIVEQINVNFLETNARNVPERHRSARSVFEYSWNLLTESEQAVLRRLSVFKGPFDRPAAQKVAGANFTTLASLVEKSLIRLVDKQYYDIHELLRQFGFNKLVEANEAIAAQDAHLSYYIQLTDDPDSHVHGKSQEAWLDRMEREHDNIRTGLSWALDSADRYLAGLQLGAAVWEFWLYHGHITEGRGWLKRLLAATQGSQTKERGAVTQGAGYLAWIQGNIEEAEALHHEGLAIRTAIDDKAGMGGSLNNLGIIAWGRGDYAAAEDYYERALTARREAGYALGMASVLANLMLLAQYQSDYTRAIVYGEQAWTLFEELGDLHGRALVKYNLAAMALDRGEWEQAKTLQEEALVYYRRLGDQRDIGALLQNMGYTMLLLGNLEMARNYLNESLTLSTSAGDRLHSALARKNLARLALEEGQFAEAQRLISEATNLMAEMDKSLEAGSIVAVQGDLYWAEGDTVAAERAYLQSLALFLKHKSSVSVAQILYRLVGLAYQRQEMQRAVILTAAADTIASQIGARFRDKYEQIDREALKTQLNPDAYARAHEMGAGMNLDHLRQFLGVAEVQSA